MAILLKLNNIRIILDERVVNNRVAIRLSYIIDKHPRISKYIKTDYNRLYRHYDDAIETMSVLIPKYMSVRSFYDVVHDILREELLNELVDTVIDKKLAGSISMYYTEDGKFTLSGSLRSDLGNVINCLY